MPFVGLNTFRQSALSPQFAARECLTNTAARCLVCRTRSWRNMARTSHPSAPIPRRIRCYKANEAKSGDLDSLKDDFENLLRENELVSASAHQ
jgi:hypothetical protein